MLSGTAFAVLRGSFGAGFAYWTATCLLHEVILGTHVSCWLGWPCLWQHASLIYNFVWCSGRLMEQCRSVQPRMKAASKYGRVKMTPVCTVVTTCLTNTVHSADDLLREFREFPSLQPLHTMFLVHSMSSTHTCCTAGVSQPCLLHAGACQSCKWRIEACPMQAPCTG